MRANIKSCDNETKWMYFLIEDEKFNDNEMNKYKNIK